MESFSSDLIDLTKFYTSCTYPDQEFDPSLNVFVNDCYKSRTRAVTQFTFSMEASVRSAGEVPLVALRYYSQCFLGNSFRLYHRDSLINRQKVLLLNDGTP